MLPTYSGLTWDHPRGRNALKAAAMRARALHGLEISWQAQPLEDFEARPLAELCDRYDLLVIDHPHVGEAAATGVLRPMEDLLPEGELADIGASTIGSCFESYRYAGRLWALPLDAASQVMVLQEDRLAGAEPRTWAEVEALARETRSVALSLAGPHAFLTLLSITAAFAEGGPAEESSLLQRDAGCAAVDLMQRLFGDSPKCAWTLNPIGLLDRMSTEGDVHLCPLVYGYVNYAITSPGRQALRFLDAPSVFAGGCPGSTLGGTGIALSRRCSPSEPLGAHLRWLMSEGAQCGFIPEHDGQPSRRAAWLDPGLDARSGGFYRRTARTLEHARVRPRNVGYISFQAEASARVRSALQERRPAALLVDELNESFRRSRAEAAQEGRAHA